MTNSTHSDRDAVPHSLFRSLRGRLLLLVLVSVLPAIGIVIYTGLERRQHEVDQAQHDALRMVQSLGYDHERTVETTHRLLMTLAKLPDVQNRNVSGCNRLLASLLAENPVYANIFATDEEGLVFSTALPVKPFNVTQRSYFRNIVKTRRFAVGEYLVGAATRRPVLSLAYPVIDRHGRFRGVVVAGIDLERYGRMFTMLGLPEGSVFSIYDRRHVCLYRSEDAEGCFGRPDVPAMAEEMSDRAAAEGVFVGPSESNTRQLVAYKRYYLKGSDTPYLFMRVTIPYDQAFADSRRLMYVNIVLLLCALLAAMALAWAVGNAIIVRRLNRLAEASLQLREGNLAARTELDHGRDELGEVARAFDEMAEELQQKEHERREAAEALRRSEEKYRSIFENATEGIYQTTPDGRYLSMNPAFARMFGYDSAEEMVAAVADIGQQVYVNPEDRLRLKLLLEQQGFVEAYEAQVYRKDGAKIWISINAHSVRDKSGGILYYEGTNEDVTRRKESQEALRESEERYRTLFDNANDAILLLRKETIVDCNARAAAMLGLAREEIIGRSVVELTPPCQPDGTPSRQMGIEKIGSALEGFPQSFDWVYRRSDGALFDVEVSLNALTVKNERLVLAIVRDVSERKAVERLLRDSEERYRILTEKSAAGVYLLQDNLFRYANEAFAEVFGYGTAEIVDKLGPLDFVVPKDRVLVAESLQKRIAGEIDNENYAFRVVRKDGLVRHVEIFGSRFFYNGQPAILGTLVDITDRKEAEKRLAEERRRFLTLSEQAPFGLAMVNDRGRFTYINPKFQALFGYALEDILEGKVWLHKAFPNPQERHRAITAWIEDVRDTNTGENPSRIYTVTCRDGTEKIVNFIPVRLSSGETLMSCEDVTERKRLEEQLHRMSIIDELTGLYNRRGFFAFAHQQLKLAERTGEGMLLFFADLDRMKWINDNHGHREGDRALVETAEVLRETFRETDILARMGGDEFAILAVGASRQIRELLTQRLQQSLDNRNAAQGRAYALSLSVGIAAFVAGGASSLDDLMADADRAMYEVKRKNQQ
jgi:diguanylate cyclase (GGDEF)-like protein/PAS domain S-box-containing protein